MRQWMIDMRKRKLMTRQQATAKAKCSTTLLQMLEEDDEITHPDCAAWIAQAYGMNVDQYNSLIHEKHHTDVLPKPKPLPGMKERYSFVKECNYMHDKKGVER